MDQYFIRRKAVIILLLVSIFACFTSQKLYADDNKNVLLVLDTSMSMIGHGGKNILSKVKKSIEGYIDKLEDGDKVTFMTFDTKVKAYPTILLDDENDKDILKKYISMTDAKGKWTYTINMMKNVFKKAEEMSKSDDDMKTVIVIMTDALDDPPPVHKKNRFDMKSISSEYSGQDWWIYFISFSDLKKNRQIADELRKELEKVSKKTQIIDAKDTPGLAMKKVAEDHPASEGFPMWIIIAIIAVAAGVILIIIMKKGPGVIVTGTLEYWNNDILDPFIEKFDIGRHMTNEIIIGRSVHCHLKLHDLEIPGSFSIAVVKNHPGLVIKVDEGVFFEFKNKEGGNIVEDGDIFGVGNFSFKYIA